MQISNLWSGSRISPGSFLIIYFLIIITIIIIINNKIFVPLAFPQIISPISWSYFFLLFLFSGEIHSKSWTEKKGGFDVKENYFYKCGNKSLSFNQVVAWVCDGRAFQVESTRGRGASHRRSYTRWTKTAATLGAVWCSHEEANDSSKLWFLGGSCCAELASFFWGGGVLFISDCAVYTCAVFLFVCFFKKKTYYPLT